MLMLLIPYDSQWTLVCQIQNPPACRQRLAFSCFLSAPYCTLHAPGTNKFWNQKSEVDGLPSEGCFWYSAFCFEAVGLIEMNLARIIPTQIPLAITKKAPITIRISKSIFILKTQTNIKNQSVKCKIEEVIIAKG